MIKFSHYLIYVVEHINTDYSVTGKVRRVQSLHFGFDFCFLCFANLTGCSFLPKISNSSGIIVYFGKTCQMFAFWLSGAEQAAVLRSGVSLVTLVIDALYSNTP